MTCKRCEDIHEAQRSGKTQNACKCGCHEMNHCFDTSGGATATTGTINLMGIDTSGVWSLTDCGDTTCATDTFNFTTTVNIDEANINKEQKD